MTSYPKSPRTTGNEADKNGDFGAKLRRAHGISKVGSHISDRCSYYTGELLMSARQSIRYNVKIA